LLIYYGQLVTTMQMNKMLTGTNNENIETLSECGWRADSGLLRLVSPTRIQHTMYHNEK